MNTIKTYIIELRATPRQHPAPVEVRIRQLLKLALRAFGLRCVRIDAADAGQADAPENPLDSKGTEVDNSQP